MDRVVVHSLISKNRFSKGREEVFCTLIESDVCSLFTLLSLMQVLSLFLLTLVAPSCCYESNEESQQQQREQQRWHGRPASYPRSSTSSQTRWADAGGLGLYFFYSGFGIISTSRKVEKPQFQQFDLLETCSAFVNLELKQITLFH